MTDATRKVLIAVPEPIIKKLDTAAKRNQRSRSAEIRVRLGDSFKPAAKKAEKVAA